MPGNGAAQVTFFEATFFGRIDQRRENAWKVNDFIILIKRLCDQSKRAISQAGARSLKEKVELHWYHKEKVEIVS